MMELKQLQKQLVEARTAFERNGVLDRYPKVAELLEKPSFLRTFIHGLTPECAAAIKQLAAIGQVIDGSVDSAEQWRSLLDVLLPIDAFYREIGGIVGYHLEILRLLEKSDRSIEDKETYHAPFFDDISNEGKEVTEAILWGLQSISDMAELYPLGGAADRLHLIDEKTGTELPAAKLEFAGRSLLEMLIRDLTAREWLHFRLFGRQWTTPIAIMTSKEKNNHFHVQKLCEENGWFGRPKETIRFFVQPLVPTVDEHGKWHVSEPLKLILKPGGHGAIWKLARDEGIFSWLRSMGRKKALVRQINNPAAGIDYGLLAFTGIGCKKEMTFGFASCPRLVKSAEGMNVLVEKPSGELVLTNIEYCDFAKFGVEDKPLYEGTSYSRFSSNTNILFVDLLEVEKAVDRCPYPGLLINVKKISLSPEKEVSMARLESTMQNLADVFIEPKKMGAPLKTEKTFVTYNAREKTISVAKKAYIPGKPLLETTEQCFYELLQTNRKLLIECGFKMPAQRREDAYLEMGPESQFLYHPALGPLFSIIRQKLRRGSLQEGSELILDLAEADIESLNLDGSLRIHAECPVGFTDDRGYLQFSSRVGRCQLRNVSIQNRGIDWSRSKPYWRMREKPLETVRVDLKGNSEFFASDLELTGSHEFTVEDGVRMIVTEKHGRLHIVKEPVSNTDLWKYSWDQGVKLRAINK